MCPRNARAHCARLSCFSDGIVLFLCAQVNLRFDLFDTLFTLLRSNASNVVHAEFALRAHTAMVMKSVQNSSNATGANQTLENEEGDPDMDDPGSVTELHSHYREAGIGSCAVCLYGMVP